MGAVIWGWWSSRQGAGGLSPIRFGGRGAGQELSYRNFQLEPKMAMVNLQWCHVKHLWVFCSGLLQVGQEVPTSSSILAWIGLSCDENQALFHTLKWERKYKAWSLVFVTNIYCHFQIQPEKLGLSFNFCNGCVKQFWSLVVFHG